MDFGQWGDPNGGSNSNNGNNASTNKSVGQEQQQQQTEQQQQKSTSSSTVDGSEMMHQFEHANVYCDVCNLTIFGFRYKCLQCPDFDLCTHCERRGHHAGHVMMRIAFPEQAPEAIKRYFENQESKQGANEESSAEEEGGVQAPEGPHARPPHHGHGHHGKFRKHPHPHHHGKKTHKKWRKLESDSSDDDAAAAGAAEAIPRVGCPYVMGKKELKKYAKQMKKMAYMNRKAEKRGEAGASEAGKDGQKHPGVDYSQCISQIQQYLNGFGIPIDVVTLYDEWGNGVATTSNQPAGATADPNSNNENVTNETGQSGPQAAGTSDLCDKLQNVRIDMSGAAGGVTGTEETRRKSGDGECGGDWTMLDNQAEANNQNQAAAATAAAVPMENSNDLNTDVTASMEPTSMDNGPVKTTWTATAPAEVQNTVPLTPAPPQPPININPQTIPMPWHPVHMRTLPVSPFPPQVPESARPFQHQIPPTRPIPPPPHHHVPHAPHHHVPPTRPAPPPHSAGHASAPQLYPRIPAFPPLMDFVHGVSNTVSNTVGSAIRNVQANLPVPPTSPTSGAAAAAASGNQGDQLSPQMNATLNQLLSMGFSNHDGWLARLVQSKNGDMDAVLSALFDRGE